MPYVATANERFFYVRRSSGHAGDPRVLFIHGAGGNALLWGGVLNQLSGAEGIALDLPGHGHSASPGCNSLADYGAAVLAFADALGLQDLVLAGHSMGGGIALDLALSHPQRVRALVLISTTARLFVAPALLQQLVDDPPAARRWIIDMGYGPQASDQTRSLGLQQLDEVPAAVLHGDFVACAGYDARPRLSAIRCPALVLGGSEDRLTPPKYVQAMQQALPGAQMVLVPGAGHMLPMERAEAIAEAMNTFLASLGTF